MAATFSRLRGATAAAFTALRDPTRGDAVARLGDLTSRAALAQLHLNMKASAAGRAILRDRPVVRTDTVDMDALARLPAATFGRAYYEYMTSNGFSPDERDVPRDEEDPELAFVLRRYRETHDFTHTLVGLPPTVLGELAVKWFELVQTGLPITALSAFVGPLRLHPRDQARLLSEYVPWAARAGARATLLPTVNFEDRFHWDLDALRRDLRVTPAPPLDP